MSLRPSSLVQSSANAASDRRLTWYFETIHYAIPLFLHRFGGARAGGEAVAGCSRDLIQTLVVITAKLSGFTLFSMNETDLDSLIDRMLSSTSLQEDIAGDNPTLDQFRKSCLLVFYEYHQCPGHQAWMRIGKLVRWAYWTGLDQIDKVYQLSPRWRTLCEDELEEWRLVWWCVYCLDSYANVSTGMPYEIDEQLIKTALPRGPSTGVIRRVLLPYRQDGLVGLVRDVISESHPQTAAVEIQIVSVTILRHVGRALRLHALGTQGDRIGAAADTERSLSALRLALPGNFFNPRRNAFSNESASAHHFRLVTICHMLMAQLLLVLGHCRHLEDGEVWLQSWQQVLEICQDVAAIAKQWNSSFCLSVDPAICIIAFVSGVFLNLHLKFATSSGPAPSDGLHAEIEHCQAVLLLFLEQFAKTWTLPRLLICKYIYPGSTVPLPNRPSACANPMWRRKVSFKGFKESLTRPIGSVQVRAILLHFESPLHPRWLQFLQSGDEILENCA